MKYTIFLFSYKCYIINKFYLTVFLQLRNFMDVIRHESLFVCLSDVVKMDG